MSSHYRSTWADYAFPPGMGFFAKVAFYLRARWHATRIYGAYCVLRGRTVICNGTFYGGIDMDVSDRAWVCHNRFHANPRPEKEDS